jgi:CDP-L-myo-inositol myo-inositolphosphotransferase
VEPVRRAVVLAAGVGSRIHPFSNGLPKPLVPLNGRALVSYAIEALAANGIEEAVVVTGYREWLVREALGEGVGIDVRFVSNPRFEEGASTSLAAARRTTGDQPFLLLMSDHVFAPGLVAKLLELAAPGGATVGADFGEHPRHYEDEATKLEVDESGTVRAIGKDLARWQALDTGAFVCSADVWQTVGEAEAGGELSAVFGAMAARQALIAADVSGHFWYDVDTPDDLAAASAALSNARVP